MNLGSEPLEIGWQLGINKFLIEHREYPACYVEVYASQLVSGG